MEPEAFRRSHHSLFFVTPVEPRRDVLRAHPRVARLTITATGNAIRTSLDLPIARALVRTIERVSSPVLRLPTQGLPLRHVWDGIERVAAMTLMDP